MRAADFTRRAFIAALPLLGRAAEVVPSQSTRVRDPATEFELTRLTNPSVNSWLIASPTRSVTSRSNALLYCSDRTGNVQAFRLDLRTGESRQLTQAENLDRHAIGYLPDERTVVYFDGDRLNAASGARTRTIYQTESGWERAGGFAVMDDGNHVVVGERRGETRRLRLVAISRAATATLIETDEEIAFSRPRPRRASVLYARRESLWLVDYTGQNNRRLKAAEGIPAQAVWAADGRSFTYLRIPPDERALNDLREHVPDANDDKKIATTSQFITFTRNRDSSVFAGASRNRASPYLLLLIRLARRELTLAEHRASDPSQVTVLFTPNSQRLLWHTDREGKSAIYTMNVEKFVEQTEPDEG